MPGTDLLRDRCTPMAASCNADHPLVVVCLVAVWEVGYRRSWHGQGMV
jgi:hypothetical protein